MNKQELIEKYENKLKDSQLTFGQILKPKSMRVLWKIYDN